MTRHSQLTRAASQAVHILLLNLYDIMSQVELPLPWLASLKVKFAADTRAELSPDASPGMPGLPMLDRR